MATNNMHNLVTLIKRLEAATLRLEDMASSTIPPIGSQTVIEPTPSAPASTVVSTPAPATPPAVPIPESVERFDEFLNQTVQKYVKTSNVIGGLVAEQAAFVLKGFVETRKFLLAASQSKKLDMTSADFQEAIKPISDAIQAAQEIKDKSRGSPFFNHLGMVADGIMLLAWITVQSRPHKLIDESLSSAEYLGNRVMQANKNTDPQHTEWVKTFYQIFKDLSEYTKEYYDNGIVWNPNGKSYKEVVQSLDSGSAPSALPAPPAPAG
ncbi:suppressor of rasval19, partial [Neurospora sp. IMI 360204]